VKRKGKWIAVRVLVVLGLLVAGFGCAQPAPAPGPAPTATVTKTVEKTVTQTVTATPKPDKVFELKFGSPFLATVASNVVNAWWCEEVEKRTGGAVKIQFLAGGTVVKSLETLEATKTGAIDCSDICPTYFTTDMPIETLMNNISIFKDHRIANIVGNMMLFDEGDVSAVFEKEANENNLTSMYGNGMLSNTLLSRDPVYSLDDYNGLKVRSTGKYKPKLQERLGGIPTTVMASEWYEGISRGTFDAISLPWTYQIMYKMHEVAKYHSFEIGSTVGTTVYMNLDTWNSLPSDIQQIIRDLRHDAVDKSLAEQEKAFWALVRTAKDAGVTFIAVPQDDQDKIFETWADIANNVWVPDMDEIGKGQEARLVLNRWLELLELK